MIKLKNIIAVSAIALTGCSSLHPQKESFPLNEQKVIEYKYQGDGFEEKFYDLNNDGAIEQYVLIKNSKPEKNLLVKGSAPYYTDIPFVYMAEGEEVQIKLRFNFFNEKNH